MRILPTNEGVAIFASKETELTRLRKPLRQSEQRYHDLLECLSDRVAILTPQGLVLEMNEPPLEDAQVQREEVIGKPFVDFPAWSSATPADQELLHAAIEQARRGETIHFEARVRPQAGKYLDLDLTMTPHCDVNQQVEYLICTGHDITERKRAEEELRVLIESIPQFVWVEGSDGSIVYSNQRWHDYSAMTSEQAHGYSWKEYVHPGDQQRVADIRQATIDTGMPYEMETRLRNGASGEYRWFLVRGIPLKDDRDKILQWFGTCTDIDEQKRAEEKIKVSEENLHVLTETMPQLVWTTQPDGRLDYTNQRFQDFTYTDFEHLRDYGWRQFVHPEDIERTLAVRNRSLETGELYEKEYRLRNGRTGAYRWFLTRALPVCNEAGQIIKWFGTGTDIDEQKRTEGALRQSQERVQALMSSNVIGIFVAEEDRIFEANDTFLRMTGYSRDDLNHGLMNWLQMTAPEYIATTEQAHQQLALHEYIPPYEKEYVGKDGSRLPVLVGGIMTQVEPLETICFVLDNSVRKELEQRKDDFLNMAGHELRTPLTALKLQTQMLRKQLTKLDIHNADIAFSRMEAQLSTVTRLTEELFDLTKIQAGKLEYAQETINLNEMLQQIVEVLQQTQATHTIVIHGAADTPLIGDKDRLGQVFLNLISNAIKYSPDANQVEIDIAASSEAVTISVRDHGMGIPREQQTKIFERFYRATTLQQYGIPGLGIGLYIVAEIVKHHGGIITIESEIGKGSTFQVALPL